MAKWILIFRFFLLKFAPTQIRTITSNTLDSTRLTKRTIINKIHDLDKLIYEYVKKEMRNVILEGPVEVDETLIYRKKPSLAPGRDVKIKI
jgi:hypothetical protein